MRLNNYSQLCQLAIELNISYKRPSFYNNGIHFIKIIESTIILIFLSKQNIALNIKGKIPNIS